MYEKSINSLKFLTVREYGFHYSFYIRSVTQKQLATPAGNDENTSIKTEFATDFASMK